MQKTILIALAGLVGTLLRYWLSGFVARQYGETFPWGTMAVNLIGEFGLAILNVVASNILGLFMVWVGYVLGRIL